MAGSTWSIVAVMGHGGVSWWRLQARQLVGGTMRHGRAEPLSPITAATHVINSGVSVSHSLSCNP